MTAQELTTIKLPTIRYWRELALLALMVMELSWIVPWYRSLTPATYELTVWRVFFVLLGLLLLANLATRLMNFLDLKIRIRQGVTLGVLLVSIFIGLQLLLYETEPLSFDTLFTKPFKAMSDVRGLIPDEFLVIVVVLVVYWRGLSLASKYVDPISVRSNFFLGLGMFVAFIFLNTIVTGETPGPMLYTFFAAALIAMGSARIFTITQLRGGARNPFDLRWFLGIVVTSLVIVGLAGVVAWAATDRSLFIGGLSGLVMGVFGAIMLVLISPLILLMEHLAGAMPQASGAMQSVLDALDDLRATFGTIANNLFGLFDIPSILDWAQLLKPFLLWGFVIAIVLAILFSISRWLINERRSEMDEREGMIERGDMLDLLRKAIQDRLDGLSQSLFGRSRLGSRQRWLAAAKIRRIYAHMMDLAQQLGVPRHPASTPLEFQPILGEMLPEAEEDVRLITAAYLRVRYGEIPETMEEIEQVENAWEHVRLVGKDKQGQVSKTQSKADQSR